MKRSQTAKTSNGTATFITEADALDFSTILQRTMTSSSFRKTVNEKATKNRSFNVCVDIPAIESFGFDKKVTFKYKKVKGVPGEYNLDIDFLPRKGIKPEEYFDVEIKKSRKRK